MFGRERCLDRLFEESGGLAGEEREWEWVGGAFLQRIVRLVFMFIAESEACFGEEGECEDGQLGRGKEDVKGGVVDPFDACGYSISRCTLADAH